MIYFNKLKALAREKNSNKQTIKDLEKTKNDWKDEWLTEWRKNRTLTTEKNSLTNQRDDLQTQLNQVQDERDALPTLIDYQLLQTERDNLQITITQSQTRLGINNLNNLPVLPVGETLTSLLTRPTLAQLNDLRREKDQQLTTKNTQIANLTNEVNSLKTKLTATKNELEKEQKWWDKWFNSKNPFDGRKQTEKQNKELFQAIRTNLDLMIPAASDGYFVDYHITVRRYTNPTALYLTEEANNRVNSDFDSRKIIKAIYQYYRDK